MNYSSYHLIVVSASELALLADESDDRPNRRMSPLGHPRLNAARAVPVAFTY